MCSAIARIYSQQLLQQAQGDLVVETRPVVVPGGWIDLIEAQRISSPRREIRYDHYHPRMSLRVSRTAYPPPLASNGTLLQGHL